ncbi:MULTISPECIES: DUF3105 domain-containing protein [Gordonia]|uniref:DUF3105 domain-containing protein n=1 Tax=Gordonia terrae C-6 TaxID=1316928 RepID=R7Y8W2_9ACTN|nr:MULTISPECIES: DUF3105 domain-containing protein [Gordonia]AFR48484.1 hypothetical protein KTR9_1845 [Gordonia sp. KTR9]EON32438.1 hypothetical protein GTC6_12738 [Gordonia terrae C-6]
MARKPGANVPKSRKRAGSVPSATGRQIDWMLIGAVVVVIGLIAGLAIYLVPKFNEQRAEQKDDVAVESVSEFVPTPQKPDPASDIPGVTKRYYEAARHVTADQRVAYDQSPPFGGPHDEIWATCTGVVYPNPLRSENAVHALEHGAVWITYNPDTISPEDLDYLKQLVRGEQYLFLSPYPGLDKPLSLQSWGHQLKLDSAGDPRVNQFITALRRNMMPGVYPENPQTAAYPETQATCTAIPGFDPSNPPPADQGEPGPDAVPMDGGSGAPTPAG